MFLFSPSLLRLLWSGVKFIRGIMGLRYLIAEIEIGILNTKDLS